MKIIKNSKSIKWFDNQLNDPLYKQLSILFYYFGDVWMGSGNYERANYDFERSQNFDRFYSEL